MSYVWILFCFFSITFAQPVDSSRILRIASCQFPVSADIKENAEWIKKQMTSAAQNKADLVHFPECALSGYAGVDFDSFCGFSWDTMQTEMQQILSLAGELDIWVVLGSAHRLSGSNKPHNCLYLIRPDGTIADRYDKRFCTKDDLEHYSPGNHWVTFEVKNILCGLLICYDIRFPELYRQYVKQDVRLILQSFYNARQKETSIHPKIMPVTAQARAATNYFYMSLTNSSAAHSWPCHFITPDGLIAAKLPANEAGILYSEIDPDKKYYDASRPFRDSAINGILYSGQPVDDPRSQNRRSY